MISMKIVLGRMDDSLSCNRKVDEGFAEHLPLTGRCSMDHNHRNDGYGTEHLYVAIVQILSTDSVKPSAATKSQSSVEGEEPCYQLMLFRRVVETSFPFLS